MEKIIVTVWVCSYRSDEAVEGYSGEALYTNEVQAKEFMNREVQEKVAQGDWFIVEETDTHVNLHNSEDDDHDNLEYWIYPVELEYDCSTRLKEL